VSLFIKPIFAIAAVSAALWFAAPRAEAAQASEICTAPAPAAGQVVRGPILHVEDGRTLCVALGATPDSWVRLTLADAPSATGVQHAAMDQSSDNPRGTLMAIAFSRNAVCEVREAGQAVCRIEGQSIGALLRQPAAWAAGRDWR
jgi:hypothetical protein